MAFGFDAHQGPSPLRFHENLVVRSFFVVANAFPPSAVPVRRSCPFVQPQLARPAVVRYGFVSAIIATALCFAPPAGAQPSDNAAAPLAARDAYRKAVAGRGLQTDIDYLPEGATLGIGEVEPGAVEPRRADRQPPLAGVNLRWSVMIAFGLILAGLAWVVVRHGTGTMAGMRRQPADDYRLKRPNARRHGRAGEAEPLATAEGEFLARLRAMDDPVAALHLLTARVLDDAAEASGLRIARSQTARDVVRALPRTWPHRDALRKIVQMEELVRFAGKPLSRFALEICIDVARPMVGARVPA